MNLIKILNSKPQVIDNGNIIEYERLALVYKDEKWCFSVKIDEQWYDIITSDDETIIEIN